MVHHYLVQRVKGAEIDTLWVELDLTAYFAEAMQAFRVV